MSEVRIEPADDLRKVAFKVCTALDRAGAKAVLTGGSAATIYAPEVYQSRDIDFIAYIVRNADQFRQVIAELGFQPSGRTFAHPDVITTLDFPDEEIRIGNELIDRFATLHEDGFVLHILTPTDCVCDRLASFFWYNDRSALLAACAVAKERRAEVNLGEIQGWAEREGELPRFEEFTERLNRT